jgi:hypothetical protein
LGRNYQEREKSWVLKQLVLRLLDLTREAAAAADSGERLWRSISDLSDAV